MIQPGSVHPAPAGVAARRAPAQPARPPGPGRHAGAGGPVPGGLAGCCGDPRFAWLVRPADYPWELWAIAAVRHRRHRSAGWRTGCSTARARRSSAPREHRAHLAALLGGGVPLFVLMAAASLSPRPPRFLLPVLVVLIFTVVLICYDEFVFHRRCGRFEALTHRLLTFGNGLAFLAWAHWCFVRGGASWRLRPGPPTAGELLARAAERLRRRRQPPGGRRPPAPPAAGSPRGPSGCGWRSLMSAMTASAPRRAVRPAVSVPRAGEVRPGGRGRARRAPSPLALGTPPARALAAVPPSTPSRPSGVPLPPGPGRHAPALPRRPGGGRAAPAGPGRAWAWWCRWPPPCSSAALSAAASCAAGAWAAWRSASGTKTSARPAGAAA